MTKKFRIFVLGAGFSRAAGFPLATELWETIYKEAQVSESKQFNEDLENYIEFESACRGRQITRSNVDFERFMEYLDIEHFLGLRGKDTWSDDGNEGTIFVKQTMAKKLAEHQLSLTEIPQLYIDFAALLEPEDIIMTFNYDTLLESALDAIGKPYRLSLHRYKKISKYYNTIDQSASEVVILKLHGSVDWFNRSSYDERENTFKRAGLTSRPRDPIFTREEELGLEPIVQGPREHHDPLRRVFRATNLHALYGDGGNWIGTPHLLAPSAAKIVYSNRMGNLWHGVGTGGLVNFGLSIIGFSLPTHDAYALQCIYQLVKNYQTENWGREVFGRQKSPLVIIDFFQNDLSRKRFVDRYRFVDWERANLIGTGFDNDCLSKIFN